MRKIAFPLLLRSQPRAPSSAWPAAHDRRIKALVVATPPLGFAFDRAGLADVRVPVQLWRADDNAVLLSSPSADAVCAASPTTPEIQSVPRASHSNFLAPCDQPDALPQLCRSASGFDRIAFHADFNATVAWFFSDRLGGGKVRHAGGRRTDAGT